MEESTDLTHLSPLPSTSTDDVQDDPLYFRSSEEEQKLVSRFLDGEMNFNDYIENVQSDVIGEEEEEEEEVDFGEPEEVEELDIALEEVEPVVKGVTRPKKPPRKLPPALKGLMGEANLRFARGDKETAVKICLEIIRQVPVAPEPFLTLAGIYEEMGDEEKALQMSLVAAHLSPTDFYQWKHLAEMSEKLGHTKQAITCYTKAIKLDLPNLDLHRKRAVLLETIGDKKTAIRGYFRLLASLKPDQGSYIIYLAKFIAEMCHKENDFLKASEALNIAISTCPSLVNLELVNLQLEVLLQLKQYKKCLELMVSFCDLEVEVETTGEEVSIVSCTIPEVTELDIIAKLVIVLIHFKANHLVQDLIAPIKKLNPANLSDVYLDIAEAFAEEGYYEEADPLLKALVDCEGFTLPGVWLKYADNLKQLSRTEEATKAYYKVLEHAPQHIEARLTLASLLVQIDKSDEAISVLTQNEEYGVLDVELLYNRCLLLRRDPNRSQELVMVAQVLFSRHSTQIRNKDELLSISTLQRYDRKRNLVKQLRKSRKEPEADDVPLFTQSSSFTVEEEWDLFKYVCQVCIELRLYPVFQRIIFTAQLSTVLCVYKYEIDVLSVIASCYNKDSRSGYNIIRTLTSKEPDNVKLWHLFNLIVTKSDDARHNRFIMRLLSHNYEHPALSILHGNNCLVSGTYKYALHEYCTIYSKQKHPLVALLLGLTYLQMAAQKFTSKKHYLVIQAVALMADYKDLRGPQGLQEVHYNMGRGFHHLGLYTAAIYHYHQVLEMTNLPLLKEQPEIFDLSREAAFNLHLIYSQSESYDLARLYLDKYIVV